MKIKISPGERIFDVVNVIVIILLSLIMIYPLWHVIMASLSSGEQLMQHRGLLLHPLDFNFNGIAAVFENPMIVKGFMNTFVVLVSGVVLNLVFTILMAYFLTRDDVMWKKTVTVLIMITMYFSGGMVPRYLVISKMLGLNDSLLALVLPTLIDTYNLIILRTAFMSIPKSLEESARLDGAGHLVILARIVVPLSLPSISVMLLYYAVYHWNAWFDANIFLRTRSKYPLQLILREILIQNDTSSMTSNAGDSNDTVLLSESVKYGVITVATVPILLVYPFLQKYFVKGVMMGAVKG